MLLNSRQFKFVKNYRNVNVKSSAKHKYRDENVFLKGDRALSKLITLLISNKKDFNHFFKSRSSDIVLLKVGNLYQNAKRYEARNIEREARDENVRAKRADFFYDIRPIFFYTCVLFKQNGKNGSHAIIKNVSFTAIFHRNVCKRYPF